MEWRMADSLVARAHSLFDVFSYTSRRFLPVAMLRITQAFLAALKSLARSTSLIQRILTTWYIRLVKDSHVKLRPATKALDLFSNEVEHLLEEVLDPARLLQLSLGLQKQFKKALRSDTRCMLPSYNHQLPHGTERGTYLALDVGGSTFRVALVELLGPQDSGTGMKIDALKSYKINDSVKQLKGVAFFDWMAERIEETICGHAHGLENGLLSMGLAWSFPIEYILPNSGLAQPN